MKDLSSIPPAVRILGVPVHDVTHDETLHWIATWIRRGGAHQIATVNPEFVMAARHNPSFAAALERADLCLADGVGITLAARYLGHPLRERVTGIELVEGLAGRAAAKGWRIFLLGAAPGVAERAAEVLADRYPGLIICGTYAGSPIRDKEQPIAHMVRESGADVLLVAYGAPAQDLWLARNLEQTGAAVGIGVGGTFDYVAGVVRRAPAWACHLGLEWLVRLLRQPWRWRRQLALPHFALLVLMRRRD